MNRRESVLLVALLLGVLFLFISVLGWAWMTRQTANVEEVRPVEPSGDELSHIDAMEAIALFGTQTAEAMNHTPAPTITIALDQKYWTPAANKDVSLYFTYNTTHWELTDLRTLASLQIAGCTLRLAGGHALGPGWSTEESSLQAGETVFTTILAKYDTVPQFITYSLIENDVVFEITASVDFEACRAGGEIVLKTLIVP